MALKDKNTEIVVTIEGNDKVLKSITQMKKELMAASSAAEKMIKVLKDQGVPTFKKLQSDLAAIQKELMNTQQKTSQWYSDMMGKTGTVINNAMKDVNQQALKDSNVVNQQIQEQIKDLQKQLEDARKQIDDFNKKNPRDKGGRGKVPRTPGSRRRNIINNISEFIGGGIGGEMAATVGGGLLGNVDQLQKAFNAITQGGEDAKKSIAEASQTITDNLIPEILTTGAMLGPKGLLVAGAVSGVIYAGNEFVKVMTELTDAEKEAAYNAQIAAKEREQQIQAEEEYIDVKAEVTKGIFSELKALKDIYDPLLDDTAAREDKIAAVDMLKEQYPDLLKNIDLETASQEDLIRVYRILQQETIKLAIEKARAATIESTLATQYETEIDLLAAQDKIRESMTRRAKELAIEEERRKNSASETATQTALRTRLEEESAKRYADEVARISEEYNKAQEAQGKAQERLKNVNRAATTLKSKTGEIIKDFEASNEQIDGMSKGADKTARNFERASRASAETLKNATSIADLLKGRIENPGNDGKPFSPDDASIRELEERIALREAAFRLWEQEIKKQGKAASGNLDEMTRTLVLKQKELDAVLNNIANEGSVSLSDVINRTAVNLDPSGIRTKTLISSIPERLRQLLKPEDINPDGTVNYFKDLLPTKRSIEQFKKDIDEAGKEASRRIADGLSPIEAAVEAFGKRGIELPLLKAVETFTAPARAEIEQLTERIRTLQKEAEEKGKVDIEAEREKRQNEINDLRKQLRQKQLDFEKEVGKAYETNPEILQQAFERVNIVDYETELKVMKNKHTASIQQILNAEKNVYDEINKLTGQRIITIDDGYVEVNKAALRAAVERGEIDGITEQKLLENAERTNKALQIQQEANNKELQQLNKTYAQKALDAYKRSSEEITKDLELELRIRSFLTDKGYADLLEKDKKYVEEKTKDGRELTKKERKELKARLEGNIDIITENLNQQKAVERKLATDRFLDQLNIIREQGGDITQAYRALMQDRKEIDRKYEEEIKKVGETFRSLLTEDGKPTFDSINQLINDLLSRSLSLTEEIFGLIDDIQQKTINSLSEAISSLDSQISETASRISALEDDLEGKRSGRREAILRAIDLERQREEQLAERKIQLQRRLEQEERKAAKRRKALAIANATASAAQAILSVWAAPDLLPTPAGVIIKGIQSALVAGITGVQIARISQQQFAEGGFTGDGTFRDNTGHKVAGVVHDGEYVVPKWMVNSKRYAPVISSLEAARMKGYADGGMVKPNFDIMSATSDQKLAMMFNKYAMTNIDLANRPIYTSVSEINRVNNNMIRKARLTSIGG